MPAEIFEATGRRKNAIAHARLTAGEGRITVNDRAFEDYFPTPALQIQVLSPLQATGNTQKYDITVNAQGGGPTGQAGAVKLAVARALLLIDPNYRPTLKEGRMLIRDPRMKERKKPGRPGARKRFQFSKR
jgi:small subunit ribosomal protein S9